MTRTATLIVDDDPLARRSLTRILERAGHGCTDAADALAARDALEARTFDLVLCDVNMPGESGLDLLQHIIDRYPDTGIVMVTGEDDPDVAAIALEGGAHGYVVKPYTQNELLIQVSHALYRRRLERENRLHREDLARTVRERTEDLVAAQQRVEVTGSKLEDSIVEMMRRLSLATELRDFDTANHIERMSRYSGALARKLGLDEQHANAIMLAARLHDAGKIGVPDRVLHKPGPFTLAELEAMKRHTEIGHDLFAGSDAALLQLASTIAWTHHERFEGGGYPRGIAREEIPLEGRIAAIADVYDALTSRRTYKPAYSVEHAVDLMTRERGKHFDPELLDVFLGSLDEIRGIMGQYTD